MSWVAVGAAGCALAVAAGAFGAHGLRARLDAEALALWETAARYMMYGSLGVLAIGLLERLQGPGSAGWSGHAVTAGTVIFAVTVGVLALGGPRWLGAVTPVGGALMIAGFLLLAWAAVRGG